MNHSSPAPAALQALWLPLLAALTIGVAGCANAPSAKDAAAYVAAPMADAEILPAFNEERSNPKVVVVDAQDGSDRLAQEAKLGAHFTRQVEGLLSSRGVEPVDDALAPKLDEELRKAEAMNTGRVPAYAGPKVAQFALKPQLTHSTYAATYNSGSSTSSKNLLVAALMTSAPGWSHTASVKGVVRVFELPTLRLVGTVNVEGTASGTDAAQGANQVMGANLLKEAAADAVRNGSAELLNLFASKGYIVQKRFSPERKQSVFQVNMGRADGLKAGDKVEIYNQRPADTAGLKSAAPVEEILVGTGVVSAMLLQDGAAWIALDDEDLAPRVRRGDVVKQKHSRNFLDKLAEKVPGLK